MEMSGLASELWLPVSIKQFIIRRESLPRNTICILCVNGGQKLLACPSQLFPLSQALLALSRPSYLRTYHGVFANGGDR